jgi:hypothetical protein
LKAAKVIDAVYGKFKGYEFKDEIKSVYGESTAYIKKKGDGLPKSYGKKIDTEWFTHLKSVCPDLYSKDYLPLY